jgi:hypothetical protein
VTLGIGGADGARLGATYALPLDGDVKARLQITTVRATDSLATISIIEEGFTPTVGDTARFLAIEALPVAPVPVAPVPTPVPVPIVPTPSIPSPPVPLSRPGANGNTTSNSGLRVQAAPVETLSGSTATVTAVDGANVTISAGSAQGARTGLNVPILRGGAVIGLLRLQVVAENYSTGIVVFRDEALAAISPGDAVGLLGAAPTVGVPALGGTDDTPTERPAATLVPFETGAENFAVPKSERAYELLASLASNGLIESQPASVFQDDGARRHNPAEDIIFSRAQIAGFIREAISNYDESGGNRNRAALGILTQDFRRELTQLGETAETLAPFREGGFTFGLSSFSRYTATGGDTDEGARDPFSEGYGARRSRTGYDTRTNLFGQINSRINFYGSFDYGNDRRRGTGNVRDFANGTQFLSDDVNNLQVRKAILSYDASNLLRGLTVNLGRREYWWGPGQFGTTHLGDAPGGLNSLNSIFERGSYRLEGLYAYLGKGANSKGRSLYGQRLSVKVNQNLRVGATSTVLVPDKKFDPRYFFVGFTPLSLYLVGTDEASGQNAGNVNKMLGGFVESAVGKGARVYGEILIDDLSLKAVPAIQSRLGSLVGLQLFNPRNPAQAGFKAEFGRFSSYTYLGFPNTGADDPEYYYQVRNAPLGYPITPVAPTTEGGAESLRFEGYYSPLRRLRVFAGIEFSDINSQDQTQAASARGFSRQQVRRLTATYDLSRAFSLTARAQQIRTDQGAFIRNNATQDDRFFSLEIGRSF